jgi:cell surface protein SprA
MILIISMPRIDRGQCCYPLYDTIKAIAQTYANLNRFKISGRSKSSGSAYGANGNGAAGQGGMGALPGTGSGEYQLGFNIPRGSVTVTPMDRYYRNVDYDINYIGNFKSNQSGRIKFWYPCFYQL